MIEPKDLIEGQTYFMQVFVDRDLKIPVIKTYIYIGENIYGVNSTQQDEWYFQDPTTYYRNGSILKLTKKEKAEAKPEVVFFNKESLFSLYNLAELIERLNKIAGGGIY